MNLTKTFKGNIRDVKQLYFRQYDNGIVFTSGYNERGYDYKFVVPALNYLALAKESVSELSNISGMDYCIMAKHPDSTTWRAL